MQRLFYFVCIRIVLKILHNSYFINLWYTTVNFGLLAMLEVKLIEFADMTSFTQDLIAVYIHKAWA